MMSIKSNRFALNIITLAFIALLLLLATGLTLSVLFFMAYIFSFIFSFTNFQMMMSVTGAVIVIFLFVIMSKLTFKAEESDEDEMYSRMHGLLNRVQHYNKRGGGSNVIYHPSRKQREKDDT